jgi:hypothetical protein
MNLRILSFTALTGMLAAAGCGGGGTSSGLAPAVGNAPVTASSNKTGTLSASFNVPVRYVASKTSSSARKPQYISPGSSGIEVLLSTNPATGVGPPTSAQTWIIGKQGGGGPVALVGSPGTSFKGNALPVSQGFPSGSGVTYSYQPSSTDANYYTFTVSVQGLATGHYFVGVVLTDITNKNFVLSDGENASSADIDTTAPAVVPVAISLHAVIDKAYLVGPSLSAANPGTAEFTVYPADELGYVIPGGTKAAGRFTAFDTQQTLSVGQFPATGSTTANSANSIDVADESTATGYGAGNTTNPIPTAAVFVDPTTLHLERTTALAYSATFVGVTPIAAPAGGLPNQGPILSPGSGYTAGIPVAVAADATNAPTGAVGISAYLLSPAANNQPGDVTGYTYVPGTNFPAGSTKPYAIGTPSSVDFTPGLYPIIQSKIRH